MLINLANNTIEVGNKIVFLSDQKISDTYNLQMNYFVDGRRTII